MAQNDEITLVITTSSYNLASLASNRGGPPDADTSAFAIHFAVGGPFGLGCIFGITQKRHVWLSINFYIVLKAHWSVSIGKKPVILKRNYFVL